jgi:hypothetical protein
MEKSVNVVKNLPFAVELSQQLLELKALVLIGVFVLTFVRFIWSLRQFALITILIGAMPDPMNVGDKHWELAESAGGLIRACRRQPHEGLAHVLLRYSLPVLFPAPAVVPRGESHRRGDDLLDGFPFQNAQRDSRLNGCVGRNEPSPVELQSSIGRATKGPW